MTFAEYLPVPEEIPQAAAGVLMLVLALVVLRVGFSSKLNRAFALYLTLAGSAIFWGALDDTPAIRPLASGMWAYYGLASPYALLYLGFRFRERYDGSAVPRLLPWALLAIGSALAAAYAVDHTLMLGPGMNARRGPLHPLSLAGVGPLIAGILAWWFAGRAYAHEGRERRGLVIAAIAFSLPAVADAAYVLTRDAVSLATTGSIVGNLWYQVALWLRVIGVGFVIAALLRLRRIDVSARPLAPVAIVAAVTSIAAGIVVGRGAWGAAWLGNLVDGMWDATQVILLTYAVLVGQLVHLDAKFRFAISRSTIAAVFVAVFFVASELAQEFFGATFGGAYVGIIAAGALVFALAPLQRAAERLAERAVPVQPPVGSSIDFAEVDYRAAVRLALRDRVLTKDEERTLLRVAERSGIPASRALAIHEELEREVVD